MDPLFGQALESVTVGDGGDFCAEVVLRSGNSLPCAFQDQGADLLLDFRAKGTHHLPTGGLAGMRAPGRNPPGLMTDDCE